MEKSLVHEITILLSFATDNTPLVLIKTFPLFLKLYLAAPCQYVTCVCRLNPLGAVARYVMRYFLYKSEAVYLLPLQVLFGQYRRQMNKITKQRKFFCAVLNT